MAITLIAGVQADAGPRRAPRICEQEEAPLFICETNRKDKVMALCAVEAQIGQRWSAVQYRFGVADRAEMVFPTDGRQGASHLFFSHWREGSIYNVSIRFRSGGFTYRIESSADGKSDPVGDGAAGVTVTDANGKIVANISCIERPEMYPEYLRRALACDPENSDGKAGCAYSPPTHARARRRR